MKKFSWLPCILFAATCFISCSKQVDCKTPVITGFSFTAETGPITDTAANIGIFVHRTHFAYAIPGRDNVPLTGDGNSKTLDLDYTYFNNDWQITLLPSGKVYRFENFVMERRQITRQPFSSETQCTNRLSYTFNESSPQIVEIVNGKIPVTY
jgi:hypothetical protein